MLDTTTANTLLLPGYSIKGVSTAGIGTCVTLPEWKIAFDVAQGLPFAFSMKNFLLSHLHQDHAAGIPYIISQKAMQSHTKPVFYLPAGTADKVQRIIKIWEELEDHTYNYELIEPLANVKYELGKNLYAQSFKTKHRIGSQGYTVFQKRKHLAQQYKNLKPEEIINLRKQGLSIDEDVYVPKVSFTGDTQIEFLDLSPDVVNTETLIMEVTYYDDKKSVDSAREWGHIHFQEVIERVPYIKSKHIVWIHMSARYNKNYVEKLIQKHLPNDFQRIYLL